MTEEQEVLKVLGHFPRQIIHETKTLSGNSVIYAFNWEKDKVEFFYQGHWERSSFPYVRGNNHWDIITKKLIEIGAR